ncbi:MAG: ankyrin repeat domain-containing protein [Treponema sp.]|nr:ankyrin repeat domain-containing protein [Treponema sp.]
MKQTGKFKKLFLLAVLAASFISVFAASKNDDLAALAKDGSKAEIEKAIAKTPTLPEMTFGSNKETFIMLALKNDRDISIIKTLLKKGAMLNTKAKDKRTPIMYAAQYSSSPEVVETIITYNASTISSRKQRVTRKDKSGKTAFDYAKLNSASGITEILQKYAPEYALSSGGEEARISLEKYYIGLAEKGSEKEIREAFYTYPALARTRFGENKETFLMLLLKNDREWSEVGRAVYEGCSIDATAEDGRTPAMYCAQYGTKPELFSRLIKDGTIFNAGTQGRVSALDKSGKSVYDYALENPNTEMISAVDRFKPQVRATGNAGKKPVVEEEPPAIVVAEPEDPGYTETKEPIKSADDYSPTSLYDYAEDEMPYGSDENDASGLASADIDLADVHGITKLMRAAKAGNYSEMQRLIKAGANVKKRDNDGWSALMYAVRYQNNMNCIQLLVDNGAPVRIRNKYNTTPLLLAAEYSENPQVLDYMLRDRSASENEVFNAFILAITSTAGSASVKEEKLRLFIDMGIPINRIWNGKTPLIYACQYCTSTSTLKVLLDGGAKTLVKDSDGKTAFDYAESNAQLSHDDIFWSLNK